MTIDARERYSLSVGGCHRADGGWPGGVLRGLATLRQAITNTSAGFAIPLISTDDAPRFAWRSLMIALQTHVRAYPAKGVPVADVADLSTISTRQ